MDSYAERAERAARRARVALYVAAAAGSVSLAAAAYNLLTR